MDKAEIINKLKLLRKQYMVEAKSATQNGYLPDYWEGKASGLLSAIETIEQNG